MNDAERKRTEERSKNQEPRASDEVRRLNTPVQQKSRLASFEP